MQYYLAPVAHSKSILDSITCEISPQVIELREQLSTSNDQLRSKDQYIQKTEEHCLNLQSELFKLRKEMERVVSEQKELMMAGLSEGMQLQGVSSVADMFRYQSEYTS